MNRISKIIIAFSSLIGLTAPALAEGHCYTSKVTICDGCNVNHRWLVPLAGSFKPTNLSFCRENWQNLGGSIQFTVVQPPRNGTLQLRNYAVAYRGDHPGHDTMVLRATWLGPRNDKRSGTVSYDITVGPGA